MKYAIIILLLLIVSSCENTIFGSQNKEQALELPPEIKQWAITASASSAYGGILGENRDDQSPYAATWLELGYNEKVYISKIRIRETLGPGAVKRVEAQKGDEFILLWEGTDTNTACPGYFEITFSEFTIKDNRTKSKKMTDFNTNKIKITLNTDVPGWNEIDAVELIGYNKRWYVYNNTIIFE